jgi:hypothetical protein
MRLLTNRRRFILDTFLETELGEFLKVFLITVVSLLGFTAVVAFIFIGLGSIMCTALKDFDISHNEENCSVVIPYTYYSVRILCTFTLVLFAYLIRDANREVSRNLELYDLNRKTNKAIKKMKRRTIIKY